jgi:hypothetical protein
MPYTRREDQGWALVPDLTYERETELAVLFSHPQKDQPIWIPKSQIFFEIWEKSRYFVGIATWIAKQRGLPYPIIVRNALNISAYDNDHERELALRAQQQDTERQARASSSEQKASEMFWARAAQELSPPTPPPHPPPKKRGRAMTIDE